MPYGDNMRYWLGEAAALAFAAVSYILVTAVVLITVYGLIATALYYLAGVDITG